MCFFFGCFIMSGTMGIGVTFTYDLIFFFLCVSFLLHFLL